MSTAALTIVMMEIVLGRTGTLKGVLPHIGKGVKDWEKAAQLGCC